MGNLATRKKANSYRNWAIVIIFLGLILIVIGVSTNFTLIIFSILLFFIASQLLKKQTTWKVGAKGEEAVIRVLRNLEPSFKVIHDIVLPGDRQNIDHVVAGPTGVFVIETKNHNGIIRCNNDYWSRKKVGRRGTVYSSDIGNPSKQAKRNSVVLKNWLESKGIDVGYITAVVVFSNNDLELRVVKPTVKVVELNNLLDVFKGQSNYKMTSEKISSVAQQLRQLK